MACQTLVVYDESFGVDSSGVGDLCYLGVGYVAGWDLIIIIKVLRDWYYVNSSRVCFVTGVVVRLSKTYPDLFKVVC